MECFFQTQKNGWDGPVLGVKQATENKRQFDEEVEIHSGVADFSNGGVYADRDGDFGDVFVDVDENILFPPNYFQICHSQNFRLLIKQNFGATYKKFLFHCISIILLNLFLPPFFKL